jgi:hypothetical protein
MQAGQIAQTAMLALFVAACVAFFGACVTIERAHAQTTNTLPYAVGTNPMPAAPRQ